MHMRMLSEDRERTADKSGFGMSKTLFDRLAGHNGDYWRKALAKFLRKEDPFILGKEDVWREISIGGVGWVKESLMAPRTD